MSEPAGFATLALLIERLIGEVQALRGAVEMTVTPPSPASDVAGLWDVHQLAAYLNASPSWIYDGTAAGRIPHLKIGGLLRFDPTAMKTWALGKPVTPIHRGRVMQLTGKGG